MTPRTGRRYGRFSGRTALLAQTAAAGVCGFPAGRVQAREMRLAGKGRAECVIVVAPGWTNAVDLAPATSLRWRYSGGADFNRATG